MNKYKIVNSETIQKRIVECKNLVEAHSKNGIFPDLNLFSQYRLEQNILENILSNSKPLEEELGKAFDAGVDIKWKGILIKKEEVKVQKQYYIDNLKLDT